MGEHRTWDSQITDFVYVGESDFVLAMCDFWWTPEKTDLNKSRYLWLPVIFEPATCIAKMLYKDNWKPFQEQAGSGLVD